MRTVAYGWIGVKSFIRRGCATVHGVDRLPAIRTPSNLPAPVDGPRPNWLLAALPPAAFAKIARLWEPITLRIDDVLWKPNEEIEYVYFPTSGCLSVISVVDQDVEVEVGTIGWEGMAGLSLLHHVTRVSTKCIVQIDGTALRMTIGSFDAVMAGNAELYRAMHRYAQFWSDQSARSIACNGVHSVNQRCARWLLMTQDRIGSMNLPLSHKFLAIMLGVRRASVSVAAKALREAGLITYTRAKVTILDRAGLLAASCSCYAAIGASYARLLPEAGVANNS